MSMQDCQSIYEFALSLCIEYYILVDLLFRSDELAELLMRIYIFI